MHPVEFLNDDLVDLPQTHGGEFSGFIDDLFARYVAHVSAVDQRLTLGRVIANRGAIIEGLCDTLKESLRLALLGDRIAAYDEIDRALTRLGPHFDVLCPSGDMSEFVNPMYRFRLAGSWTLERKGLFHIPFGLPRLIGPMRYSVSGLPCLYLGGSTHVCWRELGEPDLSKVVVSRFSAVPATNLRVLNFGHRLPLLAAWVNDEPNRFNSLTTEMAVVVANVTCWPLVAICSTRVPDRTNPERPEYLIPQLVLEWITRTRAFHGVRYFSTHYEEYPDNPTTYMSYAFPVATIGTSGHCTELTRLFELTEPCLWTEAKKLAPAIVARPIYKTREHISIDLEDNFGRVEDSLFGVPLDRI